MKILMVNKFLYIVGGADAYTINLGNILKKHGHQVEFFGLKNKKNIVSNDFNILADSYDDKKIFNPYDLIYNKKIKKQFSKLIELFKPDVVHMNNIGFHLTSSIIDSCKEKNVPVVMTIHDPQLVCPNHMFYNNNKICEKCLDGNFKQCYHDRCIKGSKVKSYIGYKESKRTHNKKTYNYISTLICPSEFIKNKLNEGGFSRTIVLRNFSDIIKNKQITKSSNKYCIYFGRLSEEKGIKNLINVLPENINLKIAGTGPLQDYINNLKKNNIEYVGYKCGDELKELISHAIFSIYPSVWYENCPLSILESISYGTPVIGTNNGGIPELINDGVTGLLFSYNVENDLIDKINYLWNNDEILNKMIDNCLNSNETISSNEYIDRIVAIYQNVITKGDDYAKIFK